MLHSGKAGKEYIDECTRSILEWVNDSQLQSIAIKDLMIIPSLLLQKCSRNTKAEDYTESLKRRLKLWKEGDFDGLMVMGNQGSSRSIKPRCKWVESHSNYIIIWG